MSTYWLKESSEMENKTRRAFLQWMAIQMGAIFGGSFLSSCGGQEPHSMQTTALPIAKPIQPTEFETTDAATQIEQTTAEPATTPKGQPHMAVARGGEPAALVRHAIAALGGMQHFVRTGDDVIVKPNACVDYRTYEYAATTNPWVVGEIVRQCFEAGAGRVRVLDFPFGGDSESAYWNSGIQEQVIAAGGEMEPIRFLKFVETEIPDALDLKKCQIYEDVLLADTVINVPIAKHHSLARLTLGMKNLMGVIRDRPYMHGNLGQRLADLASRVRPALTIIDAVRILQRSGPTGGRLGDVQKLDTVIASSDIVAADSYASTLFGLQPTDLSYIVSGLNMGLGRADLETMKIEEIAVGA
jgi:uncharacterized protein (DUF362 family)